MITLGRKRKKLEWKTKIKFCEKFSELLDGWFDLK